MPQYLVGQGIDGDDHGGVDVIDTTVSGDAISTPVIDFEGEAVRTVITGVGDISQVGRGATQGTIGRRVQNGIGQRSVIVVHISGRQRNLGGKITNAECLVTGYSKLN